MTQSDGSALSGQPRRIRPRAGLAGRGGAAARTLGTLLLPLLLLTLAPLGLLAAADDAFPLRSTYQQENPISTEELLQVYDNAIIVDVRADLEHRVLCVQKAVHLPLADITEAALTALRPKQDPRPLVFYCNGITCEKSYKATALAIGFGFANCRVYDAGVLTWAKAHPEKALFFGQPITAQDLAQTIISSDEFKTKCVKTADFLSHAQLAGALVIDVRSPADRASFPIALPGILLSPLDDLDKLILAKDPGLSGKTLYILDNVGKEVTWLQYELEHEGISSYWFLAGGVRQWKADGYAGDGSHGADKP
jgi:rhodanese-related sulfurtransferase